MIYLDNSATTFVLEESAQTAALYMTQNFYNPAAMYAPAVDTEKRLNSARAHIAADMGAAPDEIVFTSGATESNNMAILGTARSARKGSRFITTEFEHPSVYNVFKYLKDSGCDVVFLSLDSAGRVSIDELTQAVNENTALVSVMHVNNEVGAIADLGAINAAIKRKNPSTAFHSDGVQAFAKLPFCRLPVDMYSISGHKFHAPKGVGALMLKKGVKNSGGQMGGGQERGIRSGTINMPGIMAMDCSVGYFERNGDAARNKLCALKQRLYANLSTIDDVLLNGPDVRTGAAHILNMSFMGVRGEVLLHTLESRGVLVSTGSACSSRKKGKNRVLEAIGVTGERQEGAMRFSLSSFNTEEEIDTASELVAVSVAELRKYKRR